MSHMYGILHVWQDWVLGDLADMRLDQHPSASHVKQLGLSTALPTNNG